MINLEEITIKEIEERRQANIDLFAEILWEVKQKKTTEYNFKKIADLATWTVTELERNDSYKYLKQRYISEGVYNKWKNIAGKNSRVTNGKLIKNNQGKCGLVHEHVTPRKYLISELKDSQSKAQVRTVLTKCISCIILKNEDKILDNSNTGWKRYKGKIRVYDRKEKKWKGAKGNA